MGAGPARERAASWAARQDSRALSKGGTNHLSGILPASRACLSRARPAPTSSLPLPFEPATFMDMKLFFLAAMIG
ncbi:MAG TPA: hypothetical protein DIU19_11090 [Alcanivorax sp.]|nr:hypothetical protein [Alcanivorax sp.]